MRDFNCCYLLESISKKNLTYIGFTKNPTRRIRQHNGEIVNGLCFILIDILGARKTSKWRPWDMLCFVHGFTNSIAALQFEWIC